MKGGGVQGVPYIMYIYTYTYTHTYTYIHLCMRACIPFMHTYTETYRHTDRVCVCLYISNREGEREREGECVFVVFICFALWPFVC